jgi:hypothetical protein
VAAERRGLLVTSLGAGDGRVRAGAARALASATRSVAREVLRRTLSEALAADDIFVAHRTVAALTSTRDIEVHALLTGRLAVARGEHERLAFYRRVAARTQAGGRSDR